MGHRALVVCALSGLVWSSPLPVAQAEPELIVPKLVVPERAVIDVVLRAKSSGRKFIVSDANSERIVAHCEDACELSVPQGSYLVEIPDSEGGASGNAKFVVNGPGGWDLEDAERTTARIGLVLIAVGVAAFVTGYQLLQSATPNADCTSNCQADEAAKTRTRLGNLGILTAAISAPLGTWMYFAHRRATLTPSYAATMALSLSPDQGWLGVRVQF